MSEPIFRPRGESARFAAPVLLVLILAFMTGCD